MTIFPIGKMSRFFRNGCILALDRHALLLRFFEKKGIREIGETLGISDEAAKKRVARALEKLRLLFNRRGIGIGTAGLAMAMQEHATAALPAQCSSEIVKAVLAASAGKGGVQIPWLIASIRTSSIGFKTAALCVITGILAVGIEQGIRSGSSKTAQDGAAGMMASTAGGNAAAHSSPVWKGRQTDGHLTQAQLDENIDHLKRVLVQYNKKAHLRSYPSEDVVEAVHRLDSHPQVVFEVLVQTSRSVDREVCHRAIAAFGELAHSPVADEARKFLFPLLLSSDDQLECMALYCTSFALLSSRAWTTRRMILSGVLFGTAAGIKFLALLMAPAGLAMLCVRVWRQESNANTKGCGMLKAVRLMAFWALGAGLVIRITIAANGGSDWLQLWTSHSTSCQSAEARFLAFPWTEVPMPWPNWLKDDATNRPGWLYRYNPSANVHDRFKPQTGLLWPTLKAAKLYWCPREKPGAALFKLRNQQSSSYVMNGAVCGYSKAVYPALKLGAFMPEAVCYWETDENDPLYFNDGASHPDEGVSMRHSMGAINASFSGSVSHIKFAAWNRDAKAPVRNQLWCFPFTEDGR